MTEMTRIYSLLITHHEDGEEEYILTGQKRREGWAKQAKQKVEMLLQA